MQVRFQTLSKKAALRRCTVPFGTVVRARSAPSSHGVQILV